VPEPSPAFATLSVKLGSSENAAPTVFAASIVTWQLPVPVQAPLQPAKAEPLAALAVSATTEPAAYGSEQSAPQLMPAGEDVTVPLPVPVFVTPTVYGFSVNVAVTLRAALIVTEHAPVPVQAPLQPLKVEPAEAEGVSATTVPEL